MDQEQKVIYNPGIYDVGSMTEARKVILSPTQDATVDQRWEQETPYLGELMKRTLGLTEGSLMLDYGCGIGRLSKEMIKRTKCRVVGVDSSTNMRAFAANYVDSPRFAACDLAMLDLFGVDANGITQGCFHAAIAVWVLQHCLKPSQDINCIWASLRPGGRLFVLNDIRLVPTNSGFVRDDVNVNRLLVECFELIETIELSRDVICDELLGRATCAVYEKA